MELISISNKGYMCDIRPGDGPPAGFTLIKTYKGTKNFG